MRSSSAMATALAAAASLLLPVATVVAESPGICFMVYQMADNNLESFIRNDNLELIESCAVSKSNFHTYVYFDARNPTDTREDINDPLEKVWEKDGSKLLSKKYDGTQYLTWRHDIGKMVVDVKLEGERNGDSPQTVYDFLTHAMEGCLGKGATEFMLSFSSHGGGFYGFGGDESPFRSRVLRRHKAKPDPATGRTLIQSNENLVGAIRSSLTDVNGMPTKLDVVGFDACLMSAHESIYEYGSVSKMVLASEATEPGHGWAYKEICNTDSAMTVANDIHANFLGKTQGYWSHQTPKTLALVDTDKFMTFQAKLETFGSDMKKLIDASDDPNFFALLQRSRASAVSFDSVLDTSGSDSPSAMDVGSFLEEFQTLCNPLPATDVRDSLDAARRAYDRMFILRGNGPGTKPATGMHITWPYKNFYNEKPRLFKYYIFNSDKVTKTAPKFFAMVESFLEHPTPPSGTSKTCSKSAESDAVPVREGQLLLTPHIGADAKGVVTVWSEIATETDEVEVKYGMDGTDWLFLRRRMLEEAKEEEQTVTAGMKLLGTAPVAKVGSAGTGSSSWSKTDQTAMARAFSRPHPYRPRKGASAAANANRKAKVKEGYLFVYGGMVQGTFSGSSVSATGARGFFFIKGVNSFTPIYLITERIDETEIKAARIPVMYFPQGVEITSNMLTYETQVEEGIAWGGTYGALQFGLDEESGTLTTAFTLMTNNEEKNSTTTITETPPSAGGHIVPIIHVDGEADGVSYSQVLGGVDGTVIDWNEDQNFTLWFMSPEAALRNFRLNKSTVLIDMYAYDDDKVNRTDPKQGEGYDVFRFEVKIDASGADGMMGIVAKLVVVLAPLAGVLVVGASWIV